jgi:hypothetical protein
MEQVEVRVVHGQLAAHRQDDPRPQDREVERLSVVRRACSEGVELAVDRFHEVTLSAEFLEKVLTQDELAALDPGRPEEEDVRAGASGQARGLSVKEDDVLPPSRRLASEAKVREGERVRSREANDLETKGPKLVSLL